MVLKGKIRKLNKTEDFIGFNISPNMRESRFQSIKYKSN